MFEAEIERNIGLVISQVVLFKPKNESEFEEYLQAGRIGLWNALKGFDPTRGTKLSSYAVPSIRREILKEINKQNKNHILVPNEEIDTYSSSDKDLFWEWEPELSDMQREVLHMSYMGYSLVEIGKKFDKGKDWASYHLTTIFRKIKEANND